MKITFIQKHGWQCNNYYNNTSKDTKQRFGPYTLGAATKQHHYPVHLSLISTDPTQNCCNLFQQNLTPLIHSNFQSSEQKSNPELYQTVSCRKRFIILMLFLYPIGWLISYSFIVTLKLWRGIPTQNDKDHNVVTWISCFFCTVPCNSAIIQYSFISIQPLGRF